MFFIFIHSLKYINIFLILYTNCNRNFLYILQCATNQNSLRLDPSLKKIEMYLLRETERDRNWKEYQAHGHVRQFEYETYRRPK
jgi:hypothetical protein